MWLPLWWDFLQCIVLLASQTIPTHIRWGCTSGYQGRSSPCIEWLGKTSGLWKVAPTVHSVALLELLIFLVNKAWVCTEWCNVLIQVPAQVLINHAEHEKEIKVHVLPSLRCTSQSSYSKREDDWLPLQSRDLSRALVRWALLIQQEHDTPALPVISAQTLTEFLLSSPLTCSTPCYSIPKLQCISLLTDSTPYYCSPGSLNSVVTLAEILLGLAEVWGICFSFLFFCNMYKWDLGWDLCTNFNCAFELIPRDEKIMY